MASLAGHPDWCGEVGEVRADGAASGHMTTPGRDYYFYHPYPLRFSNESVGMGLT